MSEVVGITRQREGQTESRETVGGVERAVVQSNHITEWLFMLHDDTKRRVIECFLETAKIALKGQNKKFQYILPDMTTKLIDIDGDEFSENDYGLAVTNDTNSQLLNQKLDTLAQAALQNQLLSFTSIMKLYGSSSLSEKQRMIEIDEARMQQRQQEMQQQQIQAEQQAAQQEAQMKQMELQLKDTMNQRDNETKLLIAQLQANSKQQEDDGIQEQEFTPEAKAKLLEQIREFDAKLKLEYAKLKQDDKHHEVDAEIKRKAANKKPANTSK